MLRSRLIDQSNPQTFAAAPRWIGFDRWLLWTPVAPSSFSPGELVASCPSVKTRSRPPSPVSSRVPEQSASRWGQTGRRIAVIAWLATPLLLPPVPFYKIFFCSHHKNVSGALNHKLWFTFGEASRQRVKVQAGNSVNQCTLIEMLRA